MKPPQLHQQCPYCDEVLTFDAIITENGEQFTINATTTPESTAHVWTHAPEGANP